MDRPYSISDFALPSRWDSDSRPSVIERAGRSRNDDRTRTQSDRENHSDSGVASGFDRSRTIYNGNRVSDIPLESTELNYVCVSQFTDCTQQLTGTFTTPAVAGRMIVAGDGNAYVPYIYGTYNLGVDDDSNSRAQQSYLMLLRISPDGSYSKLQLANAQQTTTVTGPPNEQQLQVNGCVYGQPINVFNDLEYNLSVRTPPDVSVITNADQGVTVFSPPADCGTVSSGQIPANMWQVSGDQLASQATLPIQYFWPELQLGDGSYVGTEGTSEGETLGNPVTSQSSASVADINSGGIVWQQSFGSPVLPLYATDDGSVTVTSTQYTMEGTTLPGVQGQLGTLYTLDSGGNVGSETSDTGAVVSWMGEAYVDPAGTTSDVVQGAVSLAPTFAAVPGGNATGNGLAIEQVLTGNQAQGSTHQLPPADAAPPCKWTNYHSLCSNYNAIELLTTVSPATIFSNYVQTFAGLQRTNNPADNIATVPDGTVITGQGQTVQFTMLGLPGLGLDLTPGDSNPFSVQVERFDTSNETMSVVTLRGHPLSGWRYWRAYSIGTNDLVVETGAVDTSGPGAINYSGYWALRGEQLQLWQQYLTFILGDVRKNLDHNASQGNNLLYKLPQGKWNPTTPSQQDILNEVCQSSSCN